ncbi:MAG: hypothetical protein ACXWPM_03625 [Bdellovibrionota bacterium]
MARTAATTTDTSSAGKEVISFCTSCKMDLNHVIIAMKGDRIAKVQCLTCKKEHAYKAAKGATEPKKKRAKKDAEPEGNPIEAEWEKLMAQHKDAPVKSYNTKGHFTLGDKISHPTFGDGIVGKLIYPNKLEVIFRHDLKVLIYGGVLQNNA